MIEKSTWTFSIEIVKILLSLAIRHQLDNGNKTYEDVWGKAGGDRRAAQKQYVAAGATVAQVYAVEVAHDLVAAARAPILGDDAG